MSLCGVLSGYLIQMNRSHDFKFTGLFSVLLAQFDKYFNFD